MTVIANQPQSIGKVLDLGIRLYLRGLGKSLVLLLLALLFFGILIVVWSVLIAATGAFSPGGLTSPSSWLYFALLMVLILVIMFSVMGSVTHVFGEIWAGRNPTLGGAFKKGFSKAVPLFLAGLIYGIVTSALSYSPGYLLKNVLEMTPSVTLFVFLILAQIPYVYFGVMLKFYDTAIVLDNVGIVRSLSYSFKLVWGNWWRTTTVYMVPIVLMIVLFFIFYFVVGLGALLTHSRGSLFSPGGFFPISTVLVFSLIMSLILPLFPAVSVALYQDLKLRKSGDDLEERLASA